jgi:hypothetical protein
LAARAHHLLAVELVDQRLEFVHVCKLHFRRTSSIPHPAKARGGVIKRAAIQ